MNARLLFLLPMYALSLQTAAQVDPMDPSFGTSGLVRIPADSFPQWGEFVLPFSDESMLVVSSVIPWLAPEWRAQCVRLLADGSLDTGFGSGGRVELNVLGERFKVEDGAVLPNGSVLLCGLLGTPSNSLGGVIIKLLPDGSPDPSFDLDGIALFPSLEFLTSLVALADGSIIANGTVANNADILRIDEFGQLDTGFGTNGHVYPSGTVIHLDLTPDGDVVGLGVINIPQDLYLMKITSDGNTVMTFGNNGELTLSLDAGNDVPRSLQVLADGRIMATLNGAIVDSYIARCNADGTLDTNYGVGGVVAGSTLPNGDFLFRSGVTTDQGTTVVGDPGSSDVIYIARFDENGAPVLGFGNNGTYTLNADTCFAYGASATASGQVLVTGGERLGTLSGTVVGRIGNSTLDIPPSFVSAPTLSVLSSGSDVVRISTSDRIVEGWVYDAAGRTVAHFRGNGTAYMDISTRSFGIGTYSVVVRTSNTTLSGRFVQSE